MSASSPWRYISLRLHQCIKSIEILVYECIKSIEIHQALSAENIVGDVVCLKHCRHSSHDIDTHMYTRAQKHRHTHTHTHAHTHTHTHTHTHAHAHALS